MPAVLIPALPPANSYLRVATPATSPVGPPERAALLLQPTEEAARYLVRSERSEFLAGQVRRTGLEIALEVRVAPHGTNWQLSLRAAPPDLQKPNLTAFDQLAILLSELYAHLDVEAAPTGELLRLLNLPAIRQAWPGIQASLRRSYPPPSDLLDGLVADVTRQLARPEGLWPSLSYNYAYAALLGNFYQQPFATDHTYARPKGFPQFYDGLDLRFRETLRLAPAEAGDPDHVVLHLTGAPDRPAMRLEAIAATIQAVLSSKEPVVAEEIQFAYQATHRLGRHTGLPAAVELTVRCTYRELYRKEYHLTIHSLPSV